MGLGIQNYVGSFLQQQNVILITIDTLRADHLGCYGYPRQTSPAIDAFVQYNWPGNVRELENCMERAVLLCDDQVIRSYHLPPSLQTAEETGTQQKQSLKESVDKFERELIIDTLKSYRGNMRKAAQALKSTERIFGYKVKKYNINPKLYK